MPTPFSFAAKHCHSFFILPAISFALSGCAPRDTSTSPTKPATIAAPFVSPRDDLERRVALSSAARRVVVIGPGAVETVFAIGGGAQIVGRDSAADFPAAAKKVAVAGDFQGPAVEKVVALRPDLVIVQGETWDVGRVENWQKQIGVPVAALSANSVKAVARDIEKIGLWLGREAQAEAIALKLRRQVFQSKPKSKPTAFLEVSPGLWTAGRGSLVDDVISRGGFSNIASEVKGYKLYSLESLLAKPPSVYIVPMQPPNSARALSELKRRRGLNQLACVRQGRVLAIDADLLLRPGPRLGEGIRQLRAYASKINR